MSHVIAVCISERKGMMKHAVAEIHLKPDLGIVGDAHAGKWHRQVSLLADESVEVMRQKLPEIAPGTFAENILTKGITLAKLAIGTKLQAGSAILEITQIGKECHNDCAIRKQAGDCVMPREGVFAVVLKEGILRAGDKIELLS